MEAKVTNRIAVILDIKGWSQTKLAELAGMDDAQLSRIINGRTPELKTAFKICQALEMPIEKVFVIENGHAA